ncbi:MAG TPA: alpha/beta hydrolase-fold protein [Bdellovibrionota bacterium]|nr:alpha/beta hydrolase-fold protein [Bdellovibrionota bacterium]
MTEAIEKSETNLYTYERYPFYSEVLGKEVHWGRLRPRGSREIRGTLYLLHGGSGDDRQFLQLQILDQVPSCGFQIVLPFIGGSFLREHSTDACRSYSRYFLEEIVPMAERGTATDASTRVIGGLSMGGQAALNLFFRTPESFAAVGAHFPTLIGFNPWDERDSERYRARMGVDSQSFAILAGDLRSAFDDRADFSSHDPIELCRKVSPEKVSGRKIYFDVGDQDAFGLQEGARILSRALGERGIPHTFEEIAGGKHDAEFVHRRFASLMGQVLSQPSA